MRTFDLLTVKESISSTFYARVYCPKFEILVPKITKLCFVFEIFWCQNFQNLFYAFSFIYK